ncbi:TIGR03619 family F420-dependent LLM class oxidoreductase [Nocardiopsis sp. CT-R113]|uniref:TIGR03619 family F420-dependent LLM class oxidoreductase n=1 Tax=Nocardiopsis codii TaxID=3065942 RepID=A0ABU7K7P3_9ACTN|nr:TIGR03619 family F420-dependent LLM class oxidoreductase [Nocardiopsis sp. CT-R113]MEE2038251.1 TIGR03619 family F420-dependent LLM class oxidoreductase [Nocardiopsis sp. CT-R113]
MSELTEPITGTRLQVVLPDESPEMSPRTLVGLGVRAEELGIDAVWLPDHLLPPSPYGTTFGGVYEPLVTLAHLAARTTRIRLGTSVLVASMRDPLVLAKQAATLDALSGGRFVLGVGVGWSREEFAAVGADFATRGARTDEALRLLRHLSEGGGPFEGRFHSYGDGVFEPRPERPVPVMVGGASDRALRRAAVWGDEWQGVGLTTKGFVAARNRLRGLTDRPVRTGTRIAWPGGEEEFGRAVEQFRELTAAGADSVAVWFGDAEGFGARMERFAAALR